MARLEDSLNILWSNVIEEMNIDVFNHTIRFSTKAICNDLTTKHELRLEEVSSFYFLEGAGDQRFNLLPVEEGNYYEITSIWHYPSGVGQISIDAKSEEWVDQYFSNANFTIEIWSSFLFIEAGKVVIDGEVFVVNSPL